MELEGTVGQTMELDLSSRWWEASEGFSASFSLGWNSVALVS